MQPQLRTAHPLDPADWQLLRLLEHAEGRVLYMYRDAQYNVTAGIGQLLRRPADAQLLRFQRPVPGLQAALFPSATLDEIKAAWDRVKHAPAGTTLRQFRSVCGLVLLDDYVTMLARSRIREFLVGLHSTFADFDTYPYDAQVGLLDLAFNTGSVTPHNWSRLVAAARRRDWRAAARESHRDAAQIPPDRNEWTRQRFEAAALADSAAGGVGRPWP